MDLGSAWSENLISDQPYRLYTSRPVDQSGMTSQALTIRCGKAATLTY